MVPYPVALLLGEAAEAAAVELGVMMVIAVTDAEGGLQFFIRMDGSLPASSELAISKAYTAAALRMTTRELGKLAQPGGPLYGIQNTHPGKIVLFGGGFPLCAGGRVAGAIGVSGGSVEEDELVGGAAVEVFNSMVVLAEEIGPRLETVLKNREWKAGLDKSLCEALQKDLGPLSPKLSRVLTGGVLLAVSETCRPIFSKRPVP